MTGRPTIPNLDAKLSQMRKASLDGNLSEATRKGAASSAMMLARIKESKAKDG